MIDGRRVLLAGGLQPGDHSTDQVLTLDLHRGVVGPAGHLAVPLHDSAGAVLSGRPTVVGGGGATELDDVQRRDPHGRWHVVGHLPGARSDLSVVASRRRGPGVGGYDGRATPTSILRTADGRRFDVAGSAAPRAALQRGHRRERCGLDPRGRGRRERARRGAAPRPADGRGPPGGPDAPAAGPRGRGPGRRPAAGDGRTHLAGRGHGPDVVVRHPDRRLDPRRQAALPGRRRTVGHRAAPTPTCSGARRPASPDGSPA